MPPGVSAQDYATSAPASGADNGAPAQGRVVIVFANIAGKQCNQCQTVKLSVAPSGRVLFETTRATPTGDDWHYNRHMYRTDPANVAAFVAQLSTYRPAGERTTQAAACPAPATRDDGLSIEWLEAGRRDRLVLDFGCDAGRNSQIAQALRHAPDLLRLRQLTLPWASSR